MFLSVLPPAPPPPTKALKKKKGKRISHTCPLNFLCNWRNTWQAVWPWSGVIPYLRQRNFNSAGFCNLGHVCCVDYKNPPILYSLSPQALQYEFVTLPYLFTPWIWAGLVSFFDQQKAVVKERCLNSEPRPQETQSTSAHSLFQYKWHLLAPQEQAYWKTRDHAKESQVQIRPF